MTVPQRSNGLWFLFAGTIVLSAFLLFLVQPLIAKVLLPWFGGTTGVWATCVVFFQVMLCAGYGYAHAIRRWLTPKQQMVTHLSLLGVALLSFWILPNESWEPRSGNSPLTGLGLILLRFVGAPYFALSATGPLLQAWFSQTFPGKTPYRLYALSNFGSLGSLLLFPFVMEPFIGLWWLSFCWSMCFLVFVAHCALVTYKTYQITQADELAADGVDKSKLKAKGKTSVVPIATEVNNPPTWSERLTWVILPAIASYMLVAATNHLCQDVASVPFIWVLPLSLYLLSFIVCFDHESWYLRPLYAIVALAGLYMCAGMYHLDHNDKFSAGTITRGPLSQGLMLRGTWPVVKPIYELMGWHERMPFEPKQITNWQEWLEDVQQIPYIEMDFVAQVLAHCVGLFGIFMLCHGELTRRKPAASYLTGFYLWLSIGGAIGGAMVSLGAPLVFNEYTEWLLGLVIRFLLAGGLLLDQPADRWYPVRLFTMAIPALLVTGYILWKNSTLPESVVEFAAPDAAELFAKNAEKMEQYGQFKDDSLLSSWIVILIWLLLLAIAAIGVYALKKSAIWQTKLQFWVLNLSLLIIVCFSVFDVMGFLKLSEGFGKFVTTISNASTQVGANPTGPATDAVAAAKLELVNPGLSEEDAAEKRQKLILLERLQAAGQPWDTSLTKDDDDARITKFKKRNFYGALHAYEEIYPNHPRWSKRVLMHGRILHGNQYLDLSQSGEQGGRQTLPTTYYCPDSGVGIAIGHFRANSSLRIGAVGLGTGTLAAYGEKGNEITIYEINKAVIDMVNGPEPIFTYVADARKRGSTVNIVEGDARLSMKHEAEAGVQHGFDVLAVDAFSGDSIPTHLLTKEALDTYFKQLRSDGQGILAIHISNRFLDLKPVCRGLAEVGNLAGRVVSKDGSDANGGISSTWVLLTNNRDFLDNTLPSIGEVNLLFKPEKENYTVLWTDDYTNLFGILNVWWNKNDPD